MEKSFYHIVAQCQKPKRWRYELPNFLPVSPSNICSTEKDIFIADSLVGQSLYTKTKQVVKKPKGKKRTLPLRLKLQRITNCNGIMWSGYLNKGFEIGDGYGLAVSLDNVHTIFSLKVVDGDLINSSLFFLFFKWNHLVFIANVKGLVRHGVLYVGHGMQVTTYRNNRHTNLKRKTKVKRKGEILWYKSVLSRFTRDAKKSSKKLWKKMLFAKFKEKRKKQRRQKIIKLPMRRTLLKICARLKWRSELKNKRCSFFHRWKRELVFNYALLKKYYSIFYRNNMNQDINVHWWNVNYMYSVQGKFIRKKTKSGRIYKRLNSVLRIKV